MEENPIEYFQLIFLCKERKDFLFKVEFYADIFKFFSEEPLNKIIDVNIQNSQIICKKCNKAISCKEKISYKDLKNLNEAYSPFRLSLNNLKTLLKCLEDHLIMFKSDFLTIEKILSPDKGSPFIKITPSEVNKIFKRVELMKIKEKLNQISNNF